MKLTERIKQEYKTWSNLLTLLRILLTPVVIYLIAKQHNIAAFITYFILAITDFFDGYLARKLHQETVIGRLFDPIADKIAAFSILLALHYYRGFPIIFIIIMLLRDLFGVIGSFYVLKKDTTNIS